MSRDATMARILDGGIVAVVRSDSPDQLVRVVEALAEGGVTAAEITFTVPDAVEVIRKVRRELGGSIVLGAGTVLDPDRTAMQAPGSTPVNPLPSTTDTPGLDVPAAKEEPSTLVHASGSSPFGGTWKKV